MGSEMCIRDRCSGKDDANSTTDATALRVVFVCIRLCSIGESFGHECSSTVTVPKTSKAPSPFCSPALFARKPTKRVGIWMPPAAVRSGKSVLERNER